MLLHSPVGCLLRRLFLPWLSFLALLFHQPAGCHTRRVNP